MDAAQNGSPRMTREASRKKVRVALISALATVVLVAAKALVGWRTGSLGILSDAAHSGMDLVATIITLFAVRVADLPADQEHHYGHGKVENLSALFETGLLLLTCLWIISEALERLLWKPAEIELTWTAFAVVVGSILVDLSRSRALARVAAETGSQALEADALNFRTDIWGSLTVLVGLGGVWAGRHWGLATLFLADAVAAILVAGLVLTVGIRLGKRAVDALLDRAPAELVDQVRAAIVSVPGVRPPMSLRARTVGPRLFVDAAVSIGRGASFEESHAVVSEVEERIRAVAPDASIVIHAEPLRPSNESLAEAIRLIVDRHAAGAHDMLLYEEAGRQCVDLHLEVAGDMPLVAAHTVTERIEADLRHDYPSIGQVNIHMDPVRPIRQSRIPAEDDVATLAARLWALAVAIPGIRDCRRVSVRRIRGGLWLACQCAMDRGLSVREAHELGLELGRRARREIPGVERVTVRAIPETDSSVEKPGGSGAAERTGETA